MSSYLCLFFFINHSVRVPAVLSCDLMKVIDNGGGWKGSFCERKPNQLENRQLSSILGENQTLSGARSVLAAHRLNIILDEVLKEIFVVARVEAQWLYRDFSVQITECK